MWLTNILRTMKSSKFCLKHRLLSIVEKVAAQYPPSQMSSPMSADNQADVNFLVRRPNVSQISLENIKKTDMEDLSADELKNSLSKRKKKVILDKEDSDEYGSFQTSPRGNTNQTGNTYGDPGFLSREPGFASKSMLKLTKVAANLPCHCKKSFS